MSWLDEMYKGLSDLYYEYVKDESLEEWVRRTEPWKDQPDTLEAGNIHDFMNPGDHTVDDSWNTLKQLLALNEIDNYHELALLDSIRSEAGNPYLQFQVNDRNRHYGGKYRDTDYDFGLDKPDTMKIVLKPLDQYPAPLSYHLNEEDAWNKNEIRRIVLAEAQHGKEFNKNIAYTDSLHKILDEEWFEVPEMANRYGRTINEYSINPDGTHSDTTKITQYFDKNANVWKDYIPGITKRGDTTEEFWTHEVLQKEDEARYDKARLLDYLNQFRDYGGEVMNIPLPYDEGDKPKVIYP